MVTYYRRVFQTDYFRTFCSGHSRYSGGLRCWDSSHSLNQSWSHLWDLCGWLYAALGLLLLWLINKHREGTGLWCPTKCLCILSGVGILILTTEVCSLPIQKHIPFLSLHTPYYYGSLHGSHRKWKLKFHDLFPDFHDHFMHQSFVTTAPPSPPMGMDWG